MNVMLDVICMGPVDCQERVESDKIQNKKKSCPQWDSNPQALDLRSDALPTYTGFF